MQAFNFLCVSCGNQLLETGVLLATAEGPFVLCETCRALYYIDVLENAEGHPVVVVEPTRLEPEQEFDIIRGALKQTPLKEHLNKVENQNVNPHFKQDLKSMINESVTPSDLVRKLHNFHE
jgi:hypothetical protein